MSWLNTSSLTLNVNSRQATILDGTGINGVAPHDALLLTDTKELLEIRRVYLDSQGRGVIELEKPYPGTGKYTGPAVCMPISGEFQAAAKALREAIDQIGYDRWVEDWYTTTADTITVEKADGTTTTIQSYAWFNRTFADEKNQRLQELDALSQRYEDEIATVVAQHAMSKAEFDALRVERKNKYAGSGFIEWGKHVKNSAYPPINEGVFTTTLTSGSQVLGKLALGEKGNAFAGSSRTKRPIAVVDGVEITLDMGNPANSYMIPFPDAEDGTRTFDASTGVVTEHNTSNEAFEGLLENGDFRKGTGNWSVQHVDFTVTDGIATLKALDAGGSDRIEQGFTLAGSYAFEVSLKVNANAIGRIQVYLSDGISATLDIQPTQGFETFRVEVSAPVSTTMYPQIQTVGAVGSTIEVSNARFASTTEKVITSRKDLVAVEVWHEAISDKDVVVPLGNVQYDAVWWPDNTGINLSLMSALGISQGYSAFGDWDTRTEGFGSRWSTLPDNHKKLFIEDPRNNIYFDSTTGELVQVRYRIRVIRGVSNKMLGLPGNSAPANTGLSYLPRPNANFAIFPQGANVQPTGVFEGVYDRWYTNNYFGDPDYRYDLERNDPGLFTPRYSANAGDYAYQGKVAAIMIASVQRMSQGAYHPTFCPEGCSPWRSGANPVNVSDWYNCGYQISSKAMCYDLKSAAESGAANWGGAISEGMSGREDKYQFYNAIYAGQIQDLRLNANKPNISRLLDDSIRKAVAGEMRGLGKVPFTSVRTGITPNPSGSNLYMGRNSTLAPDLWGYEDYSAATQDSPSTKIPLFAIKVTATDGAALNQAVSLNTWYICRAVRNIGAAFTSWAAWYAHPIDLVEEYKQFNWLVSGDARQLTVDVIIAEDLLDDEYDQLPFVNLFGHPERIAATFKNGVIGQWSPTTLPNGESQQFLLTKKAEVYETTLSRILTQDDGLTWAADKLPIDQFRNEVTSAAPESTVWLHFYPARSDFTEHQNSQSTLAISDSVFAASYKDITNGNRLAPSLCGKVLTGDYWESPNRFYAIQSKQIELSGEFGSAHSKRYPIHSALDLSIRNPTPGIKVLPTLVAREGLLYLQLHGAELKYDLGEVKTLRAEQQFAAKQGEVYQFIGFNNGAFNRVFQFLKDVSFTWEADTYNGFTVNSDGRVTNVSGQITGEIVAFNGNGWGDDQKIPIVSQEGSKTDLNGNKVKTFCHHSQIPLGIANQHDTY